ncbi:Cas10/Cmr2 second palm domain-containing protein [Sinosporangium siamense]|uniref:Cas10/Cmr2 second palm domain-containing protein n=1 Tax=Sinosporangium siamense TaxID=1367973 RepID=A0A919RCF7_9ACTN|nr:hypothetical protein [Sinosporangium siamense]GII91132.1 hypothetical protein Ssi02_13630 [Sinosporangium siamense]
MYVVVVSTAGNQRYIFSSGKRQEIVGASHLITEVNDKWAFEALHRAFEGFRPDWRLPEAPCELLVNAAGGVTVLVGHAYRAEARRFVTELTTWALRRAPGLDVAGVVHECPEGELATGLAGANARLAALRAELPGPQSRFLRLPLVEDCASSGLPAATLVREGEERLRPRSAVSKAKLDAYSGALARLAKEAGTGPAAMRKLVERLGLEADWVGVVHADGNAIGEVVRTLGEEAGCHPAPVPRLSDGELAARRRRFSEALKGCAQRAFQAAHRCVVERLGLCPDDPHVLPLVLGGDDMTAVCEGRVVLPFTRAYLEKFEEATAEDPVIADVLQRLGRTFLSAGAGVAVVKRNYPFHFAYDLAEELARHEAKSVKRHGSALAFSVLYESSAPDLQRIRASTGAVRSVSPYAVGRHANGDWASGRRFSDLVEQVKALVERSERSGELLLPRTAVHDLREGICLGNDVANARLALMRRRYERDAKRTAALNTLAGGRERLPQLGASSVTVTALLDAMTALPFLPEGEGAQ